jgi:hypothetical protein
MIVTMMISMMMEMIMIDDNKNDDKWFAKLRKSLR